MTTSNESFYVIDSVTFDKNPERFNTQLNTLYNKMARATNAKDVGIYANQETLNGQTIFGFDSTTGAIDPRKFRNIFRKTFNFTVAALTFPHGITTIGDCTRIFGTVLAGGNWQQMGNNIDIQIVGNNIVITPGVGYPAITRGYLTIEYTKE